MKLDNNELKVFIHLILRRGPLRPRNLTSSGRALGAGPFTVRNHPAGLKALGQSRAPGKAPEVISFQTTSSSSVN